MAIMFSVLTIMIIVVISIEARCSNTKQKGRQKVPFQNPGKGKGPNKVVGIGIEMFAKAKGKRWGRPPSEILENKDRFEGDIDTLGLTNDEYINKVKQKHGKGKGNAFGNIKFKFLRGGKGRHRRETIDESWKWADGIVPYELDSSVEDIEEVLVAIAAAMEELVDKSCIRFRARKSTDTAWVTFQRLTAGCSSYVGRVDGGQNINIGSGCQYKGIVIHEILHALGFYHEQSRHDRDTYVRILFDNIIPGYSNNFATYPVDYLDDLGVPYDYGSVLHYRDSAFAKSFGLKTIEATQSSSARMGQRDGLSENDVLKINKLYTCSSDAKQSCSNSQTDDWCEYYKDNCPHYIDFMTRYCAKTCGAC